MQTSSDQFEVRTGNMGSAAALYNNRLQCNVLWQLDGAKDSTPLIAMGNKGKGKYVQERSLVSWVLLRYSIGYSEVIMDETA